VIGIQIEYRAPCVSKQTVYGALNYFSLLSGESQDSIFLP
jgi:hypothetical protein